MIKILKYLEYIMGSFFIQSHLYYRKIWNIFKHVTKFIKKCTQNIHRVIWLPEHIMFEEWK